MTSAAFGTSIGPYRVMRLLGRGGQGAVYLCEHAELGRRVAVKVLNHHRSGAAMFARFRREAQMIARIEHPAVCTLYEAALDGDDAYIAMRYVDGKPLTRIIAENGPPSTPAELDRIVAWAERVARALAAAHAAGVVHRDVKPGNIIVDSNDHAVVLDFGLATARDDRGISTIHGDVFGTPAYMPPEQFAPPPGGVDHRADVWALGVVLYELVTGRRPFEAATRAELEAAIRTHEPRPPTASNPAVGSDLACIIGRMMAKDRRDRYATADDVAADLARLRRHEPVRARPLSAAKRAFRWCGRHRLATALLGTLIVVLALATAGLVSIARERATADRALEEADRLSDIRVARDLLTWADELWPPVPEKIAGPRGLQSWVASATALAERADGHRVARASHESRHAALAQAASASERATTAEAHDAWIQAGLRELVDLAARVAEREKGVRERLAYARSVDARTLVDAADAWGSTVAAIADQARHPIYAGLRIRPVSGLVPLGFDPASGLCEFAHVRSGEVPRRAPEGSHLTTSGASCMVFVLVPRGNGIIGAAPLGDDDSRTTPYADPDFVDDLDVVKQPFTCPPFYMAKTELTRGQWRCTELRDPSLSPLGPADPPCEDRLRCPVDSIPFDLAVEAAKRLGGRLPTEIEWEYACRGGTTTPWYTGATAADAANRCNVIDSARRSSTRPSDPGQPDGFDGFVLLAPVGSFAPNPFGFHDMMGNVAEPVWDLVPHPTTGVIPLSYTADRSGRTRCYRGGEFGTELVWARSAARTALVTAGSDLGRGLRVVLDAPLREER